MISAADVSDLRTKLDEALIALAIQTSSYTDSTLVGAPSGTTIKKAHITEPRQRATSGIGGSGSGGSSGGVQYVLSDMQGSSRALMNNGTYGSSFITARHDYLPFGQELGSGTGLRSGNQGYNASDTNRRKYALTERDDITGLDHTWWRKYESFSGRWTGPDPLAGSIANPHSFNRYSYVQNDPRNFVDPSGLNLEAPGDGYCVRYHYTNLATGEGFWGGWMCYGGGGGGGAGGGGGGGGPQKLTSDQVRTLRNDIQKLLEGRKDCSDFIQALLGKVADNTQVPLYNANTLEIFDAVAGSKGGGLFISPGQGASGYSYGSISAGNAKITFDISFGGFSFARGLIGLHETTHEASGGFQRLYSDRELAIASYQVAIVQGFKDVPRPPSTDKMEPNSQYYGERLFKACSPNQHK